MAAAVAAAAATAAVRCSRSSSGMVRLHAGATVAVARSGWYAVTAAASGKRAASAVAAAASSAAPQAPQVPQAPPTLTTPPKKITKVGYGAPFTNSIAFGPAAAMGAPAAGAGAFALLVTIPDTPRALVVAAAGSRLSGLVDSTAAALGAPVVPLLDGTRLAPGIAAGMAIEACFGHALELEVAGVRYSVNEGARLTAAGRAPPRPAWMSSTAKLVGGVGALAAGLAFWNAVLPEGHNKFKN